MPLQKIAGSDSDHQSIHATTKGIFMHVQDYALHGHVQGPALASTAYQRLQSIVKLMASQGDRSQQGNIHV